MTKKAGTTFKPYVDERKLESQRGSRRALELPTVPIGDSIHRVDSGVSDNGLINSNSLVKGLANSGSPATAVNNLISHQHQSSSSYQLNQQRNSPNQQRSVTQGRGGLKIHSSSQNNDNRNVRGNSNEALIHNGLEDSHPVEDRMAREEISRDGMTQERDGMGREASPQEEYHTPEDDRDKAARDSGLEAIFQFPPLNMPTLTIGGGGGGQQVQGGPGMGQQMQPGIGAGLQMPCQQGVPQFDFMNPASNQFDLMNPANMPANIQMTTLGGSGAGSHSSDGQFPPSSIPSSTKSGLDGWINSLPLQFEQVLDSDIAEVPVLHLKRPINTASLNDDVGVDGTIVNTKTGVMNPGAINANGGNGMVQDGMNSNPCKSASNPTQFSAEMYDVFGREGMDAIFGGKVENLKKFKTDGLNHICIIVGDVLEERRPKIGLPKQEYKKYLVKVCTPIPGSHGEAVEAAYLKRQCPELANDKNVCFPIRTLRACIKVDHTMTATSPKNTALTKNGVDNSMNASTSMSVSQSQSPKRDGQPYSSPSDKPGNGNRSSVSSTGSHDRPSTGKRPKNCLTRPGSSSNKKQSPGKGGRLSKGKDSSSARKDSMKEIGAKDLAAAGSKDCKNVGSSSKERVSKDGKSLRDEKTLKEEDETPKEPEFQHLYDITVLEFHPNCVTAKDLCVAFERFMSQDTDHSGTEIQNMQNPNQYQDDQHAARQHAQRQRLKAEVGEAMTDLVTCQIPQLFHRYYLKYRRKMGDGKADNVLICRDGHLVFCDILSTFNSTIRPCDMREFLRSIQPVFPDSCLPLLKYGFEGYFQNPPALDQVELFPQLLGQGGRPIRPAPPFPSMEACERNRFLLENLQEALKQTKESRTGGLLKAALISPMPGLSGGNSQALAGQAPVAGAGALGGIGGGALGALGAGPMKFRFGSATSSSSSNSGDEQPSPVPNLLGGTVSNANLFKGGGLGGTGGLNAGLNMGGMNTSLGGVGLNGGLAAVGLNSSAPNLVGLGNAAALGNGGLPGLPASGSFASLPGITPPSSAQHLGNQQTPNLIRNQQTPSLHTPPGTMGQPPGTMGQPLFQFGDNFNGSMPTSNTQLTNPQLGGSQRMGLGKGRASASLSSGPLLGANLPEEMNFAFGTNFTGELPGQNQ